MATFYCENTPHGTTKDGIKINTVSHYDYIMRCGKYENMKDREEDLVYSENGNNPPWSENLRHYWAEAEAHRRVNGRNYREIRLGLQEEFSLSDNLQMVHDFMDYFGISQNHAYSLAIHDKMAAFDETHRNIHCHLMFDERIIDDRNIGPELCFKRYQLNKTNESIGGWRKDPYFNSRESVTDMRRVWENIVNKKFKEKGYPCRVSAKSLKEQRKECLKKGLYDEAELLNRTPAPHMGGIYRNPKKLKQIQAIKRELERQYNPEETTQYKDASEQRKIQKEQEKEEQKIVLKKAENDYKLLLFVTDIMIRQMNRYIRKERAKYRAEMSKQEKKIWDSMVSKDQGNSNDNPFIITTGDILGRLSLEENTLQHEVVKMIAGYKVAQAKIPDEKEIEIWAKDKVTNGNYTKIHKELEVLMPRYKELRKERQKILGGESLEEKTLFYKKYLDLDLKVGKLRKQIRTTEASFEGDEKFALEVATRSILCEVKEAKKKNEEQYKEIKEVEKRIDILQKRRLAIRKYFSENQILYSEALPNTLRTNAKLMGKYPIYTFPKTLLNSKLYVILPGSEEPQKKVLSMGDISFLVTYDKGKTGIQISQNLGFYQMPVTGEYTENTSPIIKKGASITYTRVKDPKVTSNLRGTKLLSGDEKQGRIMVKVLLLGDDIINGQAKIYDMDVYRKNYLGQGNETQTEYAAEKVMPTSQKIALYDRARSQMIQSHFASKRRMVKMDFFENEKGRIALGKMSNDAVTMPIDKLISNWQKRIRNEEKKSIIRERDRGEQGMKKQSASQISIDGSNSRRNGRNR